MLFSNPLDEVLGQTSKVRILRFLIRSQVAMNGREIAKTVGLSHVKCHTALKELALHGSVSIRHVGRSNLYQLEKENYLIKKLLKPLFGNEEHLLTDLAKVILKNLSFRPRSLIVFGSIAKGRARPDSDIDLLVIIPNQVDLRRAKQEISRKEEIVVRTFGNRLAPLIVKAQTFSKKCKGGKRLFTEIVKTGKLIYGAPLSEVLRNGE